MFHEDTIFGTDSANTQIKLADERGYKIAADIKYRANSPSLTAEVQQLKAADADVLMPSSYTTDSILLVKTMAELGYKPKAIVAQAGGFSESSFYDAVGDKVEGVISRASFSLDLAAKRPSIGKVNEMFKARSGKDLNDFTSREFMGLLILADGIDRAKSTDGEKIREALAATDLPGERTIMPWKQVKFDETGQNNDADPVLLQYVKGKFVTIFPAQAAIAEPIWPMNPPAPEAWGGSPDDSRDDRAEPVERLADGVDLRPHRRGPLSHLRFDGCRELRPWRVPHDGHVCNARVHAGTGDRSDHRRPRSLRRCYLSSARWSMWGSSAWRCAPGRMWEWCRSSRRSASPSSCAAWPSFFSPRTTAAFSTRGPAGARSRSAVSTCRRRSSSARWCPRRPSSACSS